MQNISSEDLRSEWQARLNDLLSEVENAETEFSYTSQDESENDRKLSGSYYTPIDVARYFWNEFFAIADLSDFPKALAFVRHNTLVEPSVGSGILFFSLLCKFAELGLLPKHLAGLRVILVDINEQVLGFVQEKVGQLEGTFGVQFSNVSYVQSDFRRLVFPQSPAPIFFGNPPFVSNEKGTSRWRNLFADFLEHSLNSAGRNGSVHFILPISIAFSRNYVDLRRKFQDHPRRVSLSHFDNIPDTLFKAGKPRHYNTNRANSQRCSIVTIRPSPEPKVLSTKLHRWSKKDRQKLLSCSPRYFDVTDFGFDDQIPRPCGSQILCYLRYAETGTRLGNLLDSHGEFPLYVAGVARNFLGIRESEGPGVHGLRFIRNDDRLRALLLLASDLYFEYWRTIGDGFHVTKQNIHGFPIHRDLWRQLESRVEYGRDLWANRRRYLKSKLNSRVKVRSYDFSHAVPSLFAEIHLKASMLKS